MTLVILSADIVYNGMIGKHGRRALWKACGGGNCRSVRERIDGDDVEEFQTVADFELFEIVQTDTAFVACGDFADIFFKVLK